MLGLVIDQRSIQKRGGVCVRYPVSCLVRDMLERVGVADSIESVLDVTYGEGRWWMVWRPRFLVGADIKRLKWVVEPDYFFESSVDSLREVLDEYGLTRFDLVAIDPPWGRRIRFRKHYNTGIEYGLRLLDDAYALVENLDAYYVLVHFKYKYYPEWLEPMVDVRYLFYHRYSKQRGNNYTWFGLLKRGD